MNMILKNKRNKLNLTQKQVAEKADILLQQYQKFESGQRKIKNASFDVACRVLTALEIDVNEYYKLYSHTTIYGSYVGAD